MRKNLAVLFLVFVFLAAGAVVASSAKADSYTLNLSGTVSLGSGQSWSGGSPVTDYYQWTLPLTLVGSPITVSQNDEIDVTITLNQDLTIPASVSETSFVLGLTGNQLSTDNTDTGTFGTTSFLLDGVTQASGSAGTSSNGQLASSVVFFPPNNGSITFNQVTLDFSIAQLSETQTSLDTAYMYYTLFSPGTPNAPVPEPSILLFLGPGLIGLAAMRRRLKK